MRLVMREEFDRHAVNTLKGFDRTPPKYFNNSQQNKRQQNLALFLSVGCASYNKSNYCFLHQFISTINKRSVICIAGNFKIIFLSTRVRK